MKTAYFALIMQSNKLRTRVVSGPHPSFAEASLAAQEINTNLATAPFAYVRRTANEKTTREWTELVLTP